MKIVFDKSIYSLEALLKASYRFLDDVYIHLSQEEQNWVVSWIEKDGTNITANEFENELIAQQLRYQILERTADIRKLMLARAFASTMIDIKDGRSEETDEIVDNAQEDILKGWYDANVNI